MTNFHSYTLPSLHACLAKHSLEIDLYDGVISLPNQTQTKSFGDVSITFRFVVTSLSIHNHSVHFSFNSSKSDFQFKEKHMKTKTPTEWFEIFEELVTALAKDVGLKQICVSSGRTDRPFLIGKGFTPEKHNFFYKSI